MQQPYVPVLVRRARVIHAGVIPRHVASALLIVAVLGLWSGGSQGESDGEADAVQLPVASPFAVEGRLDQLYFYPCQDCHEYMDPNDRVRELDVEEGHPAVLGHGDGQMWCFSCHDPADYGRLVNLLAEPIDFDHGYQVCSGCHSQKYRDWTYGGHGKRVANWRGERQIYSCVTCHNPHRPAIAPRAPKPPPPIRVGLEPMEREVIDQARNPNPAQWEQHHDQ